jgi:chromosome segregation ATPase
MDSLNKLQDAIKEFTKEAINSKSKFDELSNQCDSLTAKKKLLENDIKALEGKRDSIDLQVKNERKQQFEELDSKTTAVNQLKVQLDSETEKMKSASAAATYQEAEFKKKIAECEESKQSFIKTREELQAKLDKLSEMQSVLK